MNRSIKLFRIKEITIKMHWTFFILVIWILAANAVKGFTWNNIIWSLAFIVLVFLSVMIRELVHYWTCRKFTIQINEITFLPTGGISYFENFPKSPKEELLISLSGPLANLAIAGLLLPFIQDHVPIWNITSHFDIIHSSDFLYKLHLVNLGLFAINLLPAFPLSGGNILRIILGYRMNYFDATRTVATTGKMLAIVFLVTGLIYFNLLLLVIGIIIFAAAQSEEYSVFLASLIKELTFEEVVVDDFNILQSSSTIKEVMGILSNNHARQFIIMENGKPSGTVHRMRIINEAAEKNYDLPIKSLMKQNLVYYNAGEKVKEGFKILLASPEKCLPVFNQGRFIGVVSLMSIFEYLMLHNLELKEHKKLKALINKF